MPLGTRGGVAPPGPPEDCAFAAFCAGTSRRRPIARACLTEIFIGRPPERDFQATRLDREVPSYRPIGAGQVDFQVLLEVPQMEQGRPDRAGTVPEGRAVNVVGHAAKAERFSEEMQQVTKVFLSSLCERFFQLEALLWLSGQSVV